MASILIEPVSCSTTRGYQARITGISPGLSDQLVGEVTTAAGVCNVSWDINGTCRNQPPDLNIDPKEDEISEVVALARKLSDLFS